MSSLHQLIDDLVDVELSGSAKVAESDAQHREYLEDLQRIVVAALYGDPVPDASMLLDKALRLRVDLQ